MVLLAGCVALFRSDPACIHPMEHPSLLDKQRLVGTFRHDLQRYPKMEPCGLRARRLGILCLHPPHPRNRSCDLRAVRAVRRNEVLHLALRQIRR